MNTRARHPGIIPKRTPERSPTPSRTFVEKDAGDPERGEEQREVLAAVHPAWYGLGERAAGLS